MKPPKPARRVGRRKVAKTLTGWTKKSKTDVKGSADAIVAAYGGGRDDCRAEFMARLHASKNTGLALLREILTFPNYRPEITAFDALTASSDLWSGAALVENQVFWVREIVSYPYARLGSRMIDLIHERGEKLVPEVWPDLISWVASGHPSPKAFFADRDVIKKVPATPEISGLISALPCGRAVWLAGKTVWGERP